ncbi:MAG: hypothetical protein Q9184_003166 [Pyrenodesmia sp. 2 TL-2023]
MQSPESLTSALHRSQKREGSPLVQQDIDKVTAAEPIQYQFYPTASTGLNDEQPPYLSSACHRLLKRKQSSLIEQKSPAETTAAESLQSAYHEESDQDLHETSTAIPIEHWLEQGTWPEEYFEPVGTMWAPLVKKRATPSASKTGSNTSGITFRDGKNAKAGNPVYETILADAGIFMGLPESQLRITQEDKDLCQELLAKKYLVPRDSLFQDDLFDTTCADIANRNEARVIQDIGRLIVPAPEEHYRRGTTEFKHLMETVNECWLMAVPMVAGPRPQPDFGVGFRRSAFTQAQLRKLQPAIGDHTLASPLTATYDMLFPFFTDEVKCGKQALTIAGRQNAHNGAWAANAVVELYRLVNRQDELHRRILSFSVSHDHNKVDLHGHYVFIDGKETSIYRHPIYSFDFTTLDGRDKWTAYNFTLAVYEIFGSSHLKRVASAIDRLPESTAFEVPPLSQLSVSQSSSQGQQHLFSQGKHQSSSQGQCQFINSDAQTFEANQRSKKRG